MAAVAAESMTMTGDIMDELRKEAGRTLGVFVTVIVVTTLATVHTLGYFADRGLHALHDWLHPDAPR